MKRYGKAILSLLDNGHLTFGTSDNGVFEYVTESIIKPFMLKKKLTIEKDKSGWCCVYVQDNHRRWRCEVYNHIEIHLLNSGWEPYCDNFDYRGNCGSFSCYRHEY